MFYLLKKKIAKIFGERVEAQYTYPYIVSNNIHFLVTTHTSNARNKWETELHQNCY